MHKHNIKLFVSMLKLNETETEQYVPILEKQSEEYETNNICTKNSNCSQSIVFDFSKRNKSNNHNEIYLSTNSELMSINSYIYNNSIDTLEPLTHIIT